VKIQLNSLIFFLCILSYIIYPVWYVPRIFVNRVVLFNLFFLIAILLLISPLKRYSVKIPLLKIRKHFFTENTANITILLIVVLLHIPFWTLPIHTGGDEQSHAGPAAFLLGKLDTIIPIEVLRIASYFFIILVVYIVWYFIKKEKIIPILPKINVRLLLFICYIGLNMYFVAVNHLKVIDKIGKWETILRYPPMSKFMYLSGYILFGIHEIVPRVIQFAFIAMTALVLIKIAKLSYTKISSSIFLATTCFFPTFFNLSNFSELEAGTVFFFALTTYLYLRSIKEKSIEYIFYCLTILAIGMLYKRLLLGCIIILLLWSVYFYYADETQRKFYLTYIKNLWIPAIFGLPFIVVSWVYGVRGAGLMLHNFLDPAVLVLNLKCIFYTLGTVLTSLIAVSTFYCIVKSGFKSYIINFMLFLFVLYYIMISGTSAVGYVRHAQPFYLPLVFFCCIFLSDIAGKINSKVTSTALIIFIMCIFIYHSVLEEHPFQRKTLSNRSESVYPYNHLMEYIKHNVTLPISIYAPMECEPSHFYLAKYKLVNKVQWERKIQGELTTESIIQYMENKKIDFLFLPNVKEFENIIREIFSSKKFYLHRGFNYNGNMGFLFSKRLEVRRNKNQNSL